MLALFVVPDAARRSLRLRADPAAGSPSDPIDAGGILTDLKTVLRRRLAPLNVRAREQILTLLAGMTSEHKSRRCVQLAENLRLARDVLRLVLPQVVVSAEVRRGLHIDALFGIDRRSFYITGWASFASECPARLTAVSPEGSRVELAGRAFWHRRPDIDQFYNLPSDQAQESKAGFLCYFELPSPSSLRRGWIVEAADADGDAVEAPAPEVCTEIKKAQQSLIGALNCERLPAQELRVGHILPAITRLQERHHASIQIDRVQQYGRGPESPAVSIVIPLYRRVDFLEHQLAQFVHDPEFRAVDLIYVLDSPELTNGLMDSAARLFELYRVPFRLAALRSNAGYAGVNNQGAELARGRLLLLLNSDILPDRPGWLGQMRSFYDSKPSIGALGVKLLFEDDTLQHAGLYFCRAPTSCPASELWENQHYFKGLDRGLPAANVTRKVPAVSGACLMIARELYQKMAGLRGVYVQGDYEDSDLCLRLAGAGRENWYLPGVELYHLEGQSYASGDRGRNLALNGWLHTHLCGGQIKRVMRESGTGME